MPPNVKYQERFLKAYREARENKRGLWREDINPFFLNLHFQKFPQKSILQLEINNWRGKILPQDSVKDRSLF